MGAVAASFLLPKVILGANQAGGPAKPNHHAEFTAAILRLTMQEAVGFLGFVGGMLMLDIRMMLPFSLVSLSLLICFPPKLPEA